MISEWMGIVKLECQGLEFIRVWLEAKRAPLNSSSISISGDLRSYAIRAYYKKKGQYTIVWKLAQNTEG
jgi:hypothetical protein